MGKRARAADAEDNIAKETALKQPQERLAALQRELQGQAAQYEQLALAINEQAKVGRLPRTGGSAGRVSFF